MILLDTSVLSLVLRRRAPQQPEPSVVTMVRRMVREDLPLTVPGIVLQELLSGVRTQAQFHHLSRLLEAFPVLEAERHHHVRAARIANACRRRGIATSAVDCLISALAIEHNAPLLTMDEDFVRMAPHCGLRLLKVGEHGDA